MVLLVKLNQYRLIIYIINSRW